MSFQGNTTPQDDPEVRDMRPEQEGLELIKSYSAYFTATLWYKGVTINAAEGQPLTQSGTERFTAVVHYQATFVSRLPFQHTVLYLFHEQSHSSSTGCHGY